MQHGRRHATGGSDPIPGIGAFQIPFAVLSTSSPISLTADNAEHALSMQSGVSGVFETSDSTIFTNGSKNVGLGTQYGIEMHSDGTYVVMEDYFVYNGTAGVLANLYHTIFGGSDVSFWQFGRTGALLQDGWDRGQPTSTTHISFAEIVDSTTGSAPMWVLPYGKIASGSNPTVDVKTFVWYLGPYAGGNI